MSPLIASRFSLSSTRRRSVGVTARLTIWRYSASLRQLVLPCPSLLPTAKFPSGLVPGGWGAVPHPSSLVARQHRRGTAWSKATTIGHGFEPVAAVDGKGVVTVVWRGVRKGFSDGVLAARHPAKGRWSKPVRISHDVKIAGYPTDGDDVVGAVNLAVAVGPVTGVVATWEWGSDNRPFPFRIQAAVLPPGGHWKAPFAVTPPNWSRHPNVAVAGDGTTYVTFLGNADGGTRWPLKVRQRSPHGAWSTTKTLAPASAPSLMQVAANRAGDVVVGFVDGSDELSAVSRPRHAAWNAPERVDAGVAFWDYSMAILDSGAVVAALERGGGGILFTRRAPAGGWSTPAVLDPGLSDRVHLGANRVGDVLVCWGTSTLYARYLAHGGGWTPRFTVSPHLNALVGFHVAVAPSGDAAALWDQGGATLRARLMAS